MLPLFCYQISPVQNSSKSEPSHRFGISQSPYISDYLIHPSSKNSTFLDLYLGNNVDLLLKLPVYQLENISNTKCNLVIVITCHGQKFTGYFEDSVMNNHFLWTEKRLWYGFTFVPNTKPLQYGFRAPRFEGILTFINNLPDTVQHVDIVFAQCYGGYMAEKINTTFTMPKRSCSVIGLSYGTTSRLIYCAETTIKKIATHYEIALWFAKKYGDEEDVERIKDLIKYVDNDFILEKTTK